VNNQFLKDLFEACVMPSVDYLVIAVRNDYRGQNDFEKVCAFLDSLYASDRLRLPLAGVLVEFDRTEMIFSNPSDERTENYITGRFG
jgi:hypothetical protein